MGKHLWIKSSKDAIHKSQGPKSGKTQEKKEDKKRKNGSKKDKSPKKSQTENNKANNDGIAPSIRMWCVRKVVE